MAIYVNPVLRIKDLGRLLHYDSEKPEKGATRDLASVMKLARKMVAPPMERLLKEVEGK